MAPAEQTATGLQLDREKNPQKNALNRRCVSSHSFAEFFLESALSLHEEFISWSIVR
jgi:uncharacterized Rmd1/YagE family protein